MPDAARHRDPAWAWLGLLTVLALALRVAGSNSGLWYDEILTLEQSVRAPLTRIVTEVPGENQHTLFSILAHLSITAFGEHPWSLRLPAILFGTATVPALYLLAREVAGRREALLASLLLAVAYHHVWFSQNARGYSMLAFFAVASSWWLMRGLRRGRATDFAWYGVTAALGAYTHPTMVFLVASQALLCAVPSAWPGLDPDRAGRWRYPVLGIGTAGILTLLLYGPVLMAVRQVFVEAPEAMGGATASWALIELLRNLQIGVGSALGAIAGAGLVVCGAWSYLRRHRFMLGLLVLPAPLTVMTALVLHRPVRPRFLFYLAGFAVLILVRGALAAGTRLSSGGRATDISPLGVALVLLMAGGSVVALGPNYRYPKQDFEGARQFVESSRAVGEPIVAVSGARFVFVTFYGRPWLALNSASEVQRVRAQGRRVWVVRTLDQYIRLDTPDLWRLLQTECTVERVFHGTLGDGDVTVCAMLPIPPAVP